MVHGVHIAPANRDGHLKYKFFDFWQCEFHGDFLNVRCVFEVFYKDRGLYLLQAF